MGESEAVIPDLSGLRGIVAPEILDAAEVASRMLRDAGVPHALIGGLAVGAHGYPRTTDDVDFLVGDEAFEKHAGGLVTLKVPLIAVGSVRIDFVSIDESKGERDHLRPIVETSRQRHGIPIAPITAVVYTKLKASRQKDIADVVELLKRGKIDIVAMDRHLEKHAPEQLSKWQHTKQIAAREE